jgi:hypothetical protein
MEGRWDGSWRKCEDRQAFLKIGTTIAILRAEGNTPDESERLKIYVIGAWRYVGSVSLITVGLMLS